MNYKREAWYNPLMFTEKEDSEASERNKNIIKSHVDKFDKMTRRNNGS